MVCIKHHLFPIQTHIYILSGDRLKVIGDSELDTDALQAVPQDHTYGIKIACKLMHVGCCRMSQVMKTHMRHPSVPQKLTKIRGYPLPALRCPVGLGDNQIIVIAGLSRSGQQSSLFGL